MLAASGGGHRAVVAFGLCAAFSGVTGLALLAAVVEGRVWGPGLEPLALGLAGLAGVLSLSLREP